MQNITSKIADYFNDTYAKHGETAKGVDWNSEASQLIRFEQLCRIIGDEGPFSINDLGSGYGALVDYLQDHYSDFSYHGYDVSEPLIEAAKKRHAGKTQVQFSVSNALNEVADYSVASGIFNAHMQFSPEAWQQHIEETVDALDRASTKGFAFNCLTIYSDADKMRPDLYYSDPCFWFDRCKRTYSRQVALLHDYGPYEFTILVRKTS